MSSLWQAYRRDALRDDLVAAFIVAILLIPQSLAYALLAGLPPQVGVYASLLPMAVYAALGSSSVNSVGPVAVVALLTAHAIEPVVATGTPATAAALVLAAEAGLMLAAAALFRLDALAALLSTPVLHGFSTGAALAITLSQLPALLGSPAKGFTAPALLGSWWATGAAGHALTAAFGLVALALLWWSRRSARGLLERWLPPHNASLLARCAPLAVVALGVVLAWALHADARGVALVGTLPAFALPLALPPLDPALWWRLLPSAAPLALVTFVSSLAVSEGLALRRREQVDARRELTGLAAADLVAACSAGMPVGGSFSRG
ncbi:SulP family inorganic anion transporter, partial [Piscinibacter sp.]